MLIHGFLVLCFLRLFGCISKHNIIVVIAFDGFRYDYLTRGRTPVLDEIMRNGSSAKYLMNQFPTVTFTNFHSISTGMYPETHGVLGYSAFTEDFRCIPYGYELFHYNEDIVPIWMLNEYAGDQRYSGVMWPGGQFKYQNRTPTHMLDFDPKFSWTKRVDTIISWIQNSTTPANLVFMYFEEPDESGHIYGPASDEVNQQLSRINSIMEYYLNSLTNNGLKHYVNTLILSDHGMSAIKQDEILNLDDYVDPKTYESCGISPAIQIQPKSGYRDIVYKNLTKAAAKLKTFAVYKHADIPERWHIKNSRRKSDLFIEAKIPYVFKDVASLKGIHGYDSKQPEMHPIYMGIGPLIRRNYTVEPFENIDIYPLLSLVLDLKLPPVPVSPNGTIPRIRKMLRHYRRYPKKF